MQDIELYIEKLVLHGFDVGDRYLIGDALRDELVRLFAEQGVPPALARGKEVAHLDGGAFEVALGAEPVEIGTQVAHALYRGL